MFSVDTAETDTQLVAGAVREIAKRTRFPVAFGGLEVDGAVRISSVVGTRTRSLDGLTVRRDRGLGGKAMTELRPRMTPDYRTARHITHDYDVHVLGEGITTLLAVPVVVDGVTRGVLYGGSWDSANVGDVVAAPAFHVADALAAELRIRDEVRRRVDSMATAVPPASGPLPASQREELRESYAELRGIAASVQDAALRERLEKLERRLAALSGEEHPTTGPFLDVRLSPREIDVLACAALGATNAQIAATLELREGTVKAYLGSAMAKLEASTRHAAVARARRAGLLP
ncbi:helix-turn-helix transcriptional regulator [Micromonospora sp. DT81.3]|uniref:helix-turn-helix transcriptional regulator n=1 Tax=Micromonospora sp. DT81.3 TaxID=3416523 RepID=UPI003CE8CC91